MKKYILVIIFLSIIIYSLCVDTIIEKFTNDNTIFIKSNELGLFLIKNEDKYYNTFNKFDMKVRNINSIEDYNAKIMKSVINPNKDVMIRINKLIDKILQLNMNYNYFNKKKIDNIKWKIGFIKGKEYEHGLPHTRSDTIILPIEYVNQINNYKLMKLLLHEFIHIYQKININDVDIYLQENNYTVSQKRSNIHNIRANPDVNDTIYKKNNHECYAIYEDNAITVSDIIQYGDYEHPYEEMAYILSDKIVNMFSV
jgi:hypothetical protein